MMQFMRFRSPNSSSSSKDNELKQSSPSPSTSNAPPPSLSSSSSSMATGRPIRLVYSDSKGKFQMDPEAVAALQLVKGPIGVVSVCGRARQGKSYILNKLLGGSSGFQVASTHKPCTKGLWMWSAPLKRKSIDGTEYNLVLLDSEGIDAYDQTGTYSTQIFSLALLLSSMFIYNQMGGIDEAALDRLSLVTEMTRHIRVKAERSSDSELGEYSPIFVWLLRDFYLDLVEDGRRITPRDYLELALRPMVGEGRDVGPRNEIRRSIRALFPERECFTLVRPLTDEAALQKLDQIPLQDLRPEFKAGLGALIRFVQERTKPKQVGATVMTGPIFVGLTQSFLDALNNGAVPTIASAWQSVEEVECRKSYELAAEVYMSSFDRSKPPDAVLLGETHEDAVRKSMAAFNANAVGAGEARQRYNNMLNSFLRKAFEDYKRTAFMEAELKCSNALQSMERDLRAICNTPNVKLDQVLKVLHDLCSEYESSSYGPGKWQKLSSFLQQSLEGPVFDLVRKKLDQLISEKSEVMLKLRVSDDKLELLRKQLEANEKHRADLLKRYEEAISDKRKTTEEYSGRVFDLQSKYSSLEGRYSNLSKTLEAEKQESAEWKRKYENTVSKKAAEEERINAERTALQSRTSTAEARLAAALEQSQAAQEEAAEWRRKFDNAVKEAKLALEKAAAVQERFNKQIQLKEESLKAEFSASLIRKDEEIKDKIKRLEKAEHQVISLISQLKASEAKIRDHDLEGTTLKDEIKELQEKLDSAKSAAQSYEREAKIMEQQKNHIEQRYLSEFKRFEEVEDRCRAAEKEAKRAVELADKARTDAVVAQREKNDMQRLAMERMAQIERGERQIEGLERQKVELAEEVERLRASEMDAVSKVALLEARVDEREKEIEELMKSTNEQRTSTVKVLESLLATERAARSEANTRAEALSLQLESTQGKLDSVHQELTSVRLNETALDSKLKTASRAKRIRVQDYAGTESVHDMDMDVDGERTRNKRSKSMTSPAPLHLHTEDGGSVFKPGDEGGEASEEPQESEDYNKFTVLKLKQELTKHGFGAQLLQLRNPNKKDILALYEKHVLEK